MPRRDELQAHLKAKGIGNAVYYPLVAAPAAVLRPSGLPPRAACRSAEAATAQVISLPVYPELTQEQQEAVIDAVLEFYA